MYQIKFHLLEKKDPINSEFLRFLTFVSTTIRFWDIFSQYPEARRNVGCFEIINLVDLKTDWSKLFYFHVTLVCAIFTTKGC